MAHEMMSSDLNFDLVWLLEINDATLKYSGIIALLALFSIYMQAAVRGDLQTNPDWTISRVMVYPYNEPISKYILFPCFLTITSMYAVKYYDHHDCYRIQTGAVFAVIGGIGLMIYPVTTRENEHVICALVVFLSSYFWFPECTEYQFKTFAAFSFFFTGGFALGFVRGTFIESEKENNMLSFLPSLCCAIGEFGIFITWGIMVRNKISDHE